MPHQDMDDLRTPLHELKESLAPLAKAQLENVSRHGNSTLGGLGIAVLALLTFGWSRQKMLGERFTTAHQAAQDLLGGSAIAGSHQALMVALRACEDSHFERIRQQMVLRLLAQSNWLYLGRATFAVDGSPFSVPREKKTSPI